MSEPEPESTQKEFQLYRSTVAPRRELGVPPKAIAMVLAGLLPLLVYVLLTYQWTTPPPLPVLPEVVDHLVLGMSQEQVEGLKDSLPKRGARFVGATPASGDRWHFRGYPRDFPTNVVLGDVPELEGTLTFDDGLATLRAVYEGHGPEVDTADVLEGILEELPAALQGKTLRLEDVVDRLGPGLRAGRLLDAEAEHKELEVYRWSYPFVSGGKLGALTDLDLLVTPDGLVVGTGAPR